ncbi:uncharacterized protein [Symphalangus syndactylus]|uniref:uncharacterized protein n=1 Tax=Symphalangus syndactylus TaxID=9590 RepID=UPI00300459EF
MEAQTEIHFMHNNGAKPDSSFLPCVTQGWRTALPTHYPLCPGAPSCCHLLKSSAHLHSEQHSLFSRNVQEPQSPPRLKLCFIDMAGNMAAHRGPIFSASLPERERHPFYLSSELNILGENSDWLGLGPMPILELINCD